MERETQNLQHTAEYGDVLFERKINDDLMQPLSPNALKVAAAECLNSWIYYLQMLNNLCMAGVRLSQSLGTLSRNHNVALSSQCQSSWDDLAKSTIVASNTVKTHIAAAMQDMIIGETFTDADALRQQEHNQQIIAENILTFINLQYQFSIAGCECLGPMAMCPSCQTYAGGTHDPECGMASIQQSFNRLNTQDPRSQMSSPHMASERGLIESPKVPDLPRSYPDSLPKNYPESSLPKNYSECSLPKSYADCSLPKSYSELSKNYPEVSKNYPEVSKNYPEYPRQPSPGNGDRVPSPFLEQPRGPSPVHSFADLRGPNLIEGIRGPLPNPGQLHTMKGPFPGRGSRSPLHFPLFPLAAQRRWSEVTTGEVSSEGGDGTMRRWSMPWDCGQTDTGPWNQRYLPSKLAVPPTATSQDRSRSTTPETTTQQMTITSGEGLADAIQLLSCRPMRNSIPHGSMSNHTITFGTTWTECHEDRIHRKMFQSQRGNWQSLDVPHSSGMAVTEHFDIFPPVLPLTSRKSSSSTDSSSCLSIHSRSTSSSERGSDTTAGGESIRLHTNLYSMWSGNEHLPFIRLPESQEPPDEDEPENSPEQA